MSSMTRARDVNRPLGPFYPGILVALFLCVLHTHAADATNQVIVALNLTNITVIQTDAGPAVFKGALLVGRTGQPALPRVTTRVLLPPDTDLRSVSAAIAGEKTEILKGSWDVAPMPPLVAGTNILWPADANIVDGRDTVAYATSSFEPGSFLGMTTTGQMREWRLAEVEIVPYRYSASTRQLVRLTDAQLVLRFDRVFGQKVLHSKSGTAAAIYRENIRQAVVNFDSMVQEYEHIAAQAWTAKH